MGDGDLSWSRSAGINPGSGSIFDGRAGTVLFPGSGWLVPESRCWAGVAGRLMGRFFDCEAGEGMCHISGERGERVWERGEGQLVRGARE